MLGRSTLLLLACLVVGAYAAPPVEQVYTHPLTNLPPAGEISTSFFFPDAPNKHFTAGEPVKVVVGIHNDGTEAYNISAIMGSLNSPMDFKMYIQNFTQQVYFDLLEPGQEQSVEYAFTPAKELTPRDFIVALTLFYQTSTGSFLSSTFFNQTVEIIEQKKLIDTELIFLYVLLLAIASGAGYFLYQQIQGAGLLKGFQKKSKKVETVRTAQDDDEWVQGTAYDLFKKKKAAAGTKKKST